MDKIRSVAVIGGGAAGLCVARALVCEARRAFDVVVFEATQRVGGIWCYDGGDPSAPDSYGPMYESLRTNLPKEVMAFPGYPLDPSLPSFPSHRDVAAYLDAYAEPIRSKIRFSTRVTHVAPVDESDRCSAFQVISEKTLLPTLEVMVSWKCSLVD